MSRMSTSDSDYSIDWLASDEDDCDSTERLTPHGKDTHTLPSSTTSSRESPKAYSSGFTEPNAKDHIHGHGLTRDNRTRHVLSCASPSRQDSPWVSPPAQGHAAVRRLGPPGVWTTTEGAGTGKLHHAMKQEHNSDLERQCERPSAESTDKELFFRKCMELQCYIPPLSSILRGLRSGRYSERLSSFQESVAMDRIQRIMGVLENPHMGGRYVNIILKMEDMLRSWFPHVRPNRDHQAVDRGGDNTPAKKQKQNHVTATPSPLSLTSPCPPEDQPPRAADCQPTTHLKWLHTSPICSLKSSEWTLGRTTLSPPPPAPPRGHDLEVTQDNAVSSSTDSQTDSRRQARLHPYSRPRQGHPLFKISSPCLERLLQAKESIIAPRTVGNSNGSERSWL